MHYETPLHAVSYPQSLLIVHWSYSKVLLIHCSYGPYTVAVAQRQKISLPGVVHTVF